MKIMKYRICFSFFFFNDSGTIVLFLEFIDDYFWWNHLSLFMWKHGHFLFGTDEQYSLLRCLKKSCSKGLQIYKHYKHFTYSIFHACFFNFNISKFRARQIAHMVTSVHTKCTERLFARTKLRSRKSVKTLLTSTPALFKAVTYFCVWKQLIFSTIRSDIHNLFYLTSCCWI